MIGFVEIISIPPDRVPEKFTALKFAPLKNVLLISRPVKSPPERSTLGPTI